MVYPVYIKNCMLDLFNECTALYKHLVTAGCWSYISLTIIKAINATKIGFCKSALRSFFFG